MYMVSVKIGDAVDIGGVVHVKVKDKFGQRVRLAITTALSPITLIPDGHIPDHYTLGMNNEVRPIKPRILSAG